MQRSGEPRWPGKEKRVPLAASPALPGHEKVMSEMAWSTVAKVAPKDPDAHVFRMWAAALAD